MSTICNCYLLVINYSVFFKTEFFRQPDPSLELQAAIVADGQYMDYGLGTVQFPATCVNGAWTMGSPPLTFTILECQLTTPP